MRLSQTDPVHSSIACLAQDVRRLMIYRQARYFLIISILIHGLLLYLLMPRLPVTMIEGRNIHFDIVLTHNQTSTPASDKANKPLSNTAALPTDNNDEINTSPTGHSPTHKQQTSISDDRKQNRPTQNQVHKVSKHKHDIRNKQTSNSPVDSTNHTMLEIPALGHSSPPFVTANTSDSSSNNNQPNYKDNNNQTQQSLNLLLGQRVTQELKNYLSYPYIARKRGWSGKVMLGFQIDTDGKLLNIHLSESSGYPVLDNSALSAIYKIKNITGFSADLEEISPTINIPVIFALQQS